jgi:hypothetical protein
MPKIAFSRSSQIADPCDFAIHRTVIIIQLSIVIILTAFLHALFVSAYGISNAKESCSGRAGRHFRAVL